MFLPATYKEIQNLGWDRPDIIIVSGDTYIDSYYYGSAVIGRTLEAAGYKVAIIAQPDISSDKDIARLGEPKLFWGVTAGAVDSMIANYTALKKKRRDDDSAPGGANNKRPDRAIIRYVNLIRQYFKNTCPVIIGGLEASLRRLAHYDYWSDSVRKSVLLDSKADILVYGEGEKTILELADLIANARDWRTQRGICYISNSFHSDYLILPSYEETASDKNKFIEAFEIFYRNQEPESACGLVQKCGDRYIVHNPSNFYLTSEELDRIHELKYMRNAHPYYKEQGKIKALDTIRFSVLTHRGCFGECNFCAITVHQGRRIRSRSEASIVREVKKITKLEGFKGIISDLGGPTANMFEMGCKRDNSPKSLSKKCPRRCIDDSFCKNLKFSHESIIRLYEKVRNIEGIRKVFIGSGIRYDLVIEDKEFGLQYIEQVAEHHVSGQLKIAPEHTEPRVLKAMGKTNSSYLVDFKDRFDRISRRLGKKQYLTYYFIAAHPGCEIKDMSRLKAFISSNLKITPEQVQIFTPTPSTFSTLMYHTGINPMEKRAIFTEKGNKAKELQKNIIVKK